MTTMRTHFVNYPKTSVESLSLTYLQRPARGERVGWENSNFGLPFATAVISHAGHCLCSEHSFHLHASLLFTSSLPYPTCTLTCTPSSMTTAPRETTAAPSPNEEHCTLAIYTPPTAVRIRTTCFVPVRFRRMMFEPPPPEIRIAKGVL